MGTKKIVDAERLNGAMTASADAIRAKTGGTAEIPWDMDTGFAGAIGAIPTGGSDPVIQPLSVTENGTYTAPEGVDGYSPVTVNVPSSGGGGSLPSASLKEVNFYDYDGTVLYAYTVEEAASLTELPALPEHDGLICQGWNWTLADIKSMGRAVNVGAMYITDDGKTRIYITLHDGRTSPMLGCCPNGTVTVDWGDGTEPDVLTGTSTTSVKWTPTHEYAAAGDYVITLTVDGTMGFYGSSSSSQFGGILRCTSGADERNRAYLNAVQRIEVGSGVTSIGSYAFYNCYSMSSITIPSGVTSIGGTGVFRYCYSMSSITIPSGVTSIGDYAFQYCYGLSSITIPSGVTSIGTYAFGSCQSLARITIPESVTNIRSYAFYNCYSLASITIPSGVTSIADNIFNGCSSMSSITIPDSVTSIGYQTFNNCQSLASITVPSGVTSIAAYAFRYCYCVSYYDFARHTAVPTLDNKSALSNLSEDCEIRVPAVLYDEWIAATNWSTYANNIVARA